MSEVRDSEAVLENHDEYLFSESLTTFFVNLLDQDIFYRLLFRQKKD